MYFGSAEHSEVFSGSGYPGKPRFRMAKTWLALLILYQLF
jgi:hypothetical protein